MHTSSDDVFDGKESQEDSEAANEKTFENGLKSLSPVFRTIPPKMVRCFTSPDEDIPSYQIPRGSKRFSSTSEEQESVLPVSPAVTPPSVTKKDFQPPLVPTIGTIVKKQLNTKRTSNETVDKLQLENAANKHCNVFDELEITEKDISWDSSMETPAAKPLTLDAFNTIERATFLPESDLKNMQPRALFSPEKNSELDCLPLKYSSESEEEKDNCAERMDDTDICKTFKHRNVAFIQAQGDDTSVVHDSEKRGYSHNIELTKECCEKGRPVTPSSPVFNVKSFKRKSRIKKARPLLVKSPDIVTENESDINGGRKEMSCDLEFSKDLTLVTEESNNTKFSECMSEQLNSIQDDSFQNMSFSYIDELIKTSVSESDNNLSKTVNPSSGLPEPEAGGQGEGGNYNADNFPLTKENIPKRFYYESTQKCEVYPMSSVNGFLRDAMRLEQVKPLEKKTQGEVPNTGLIVFNDMLNNISDSELSKQSVKQASSKPSKEISQISQNSKMLRFDSEKELKTLPSITAAGSVVMTGKNTDSFNDVSSHFDDNDTQMCLTAAYAESLIINNPESIDGGHLTGSLNGDIGNIKTSHASSAIAPDLDESRSQNNESNTPQTLPMFTTALGNSVSISNGAYKKVQKLFAEELKENESVKPELISDSEGTKGSHGFQGFKTASGAAVKICKNSLVKVKNIFRDMEVDGDNVEASFVKDGSMCTGFTTASGTEVKVSEDSFKKAKIVIGSMDDKNEMEDELCEEPKEIPSHVSFMTASNKPVEISNKALNKANSFWKGEVEVDCFGATDEREGTKFKEHQPAEPKNLKNPEFQEVESVMPEPGFCGFSTASGKNISVSEKALANVRKMLGEKEEPFEPCGPHSSKEERIDEKSTEVQLKTSSPNLTQSERDSALADENSAEDSHLVPPWLHAYNTSPTLTMDRMHLEAVTSHEDFRQQSTSREQYLVTSPILGATDRFYDRREGRSRCRKLLFDASPKREKSNGSAGKPNFIAPYKMGARNSAMKRDLLQLNIDFTVPFKRRKLEEPTNEESPDDIGKLTEDVMERREKARSEQRKAGRKGKEKPTKGSHLLKKREPQMSLSDAVGGGFPERYPVDVLQKHGVRDDVLHITVHNASDYRFRCLDFYTSAHCLTNVNGFPVGDGCSLIFDDDNTAGVDDVTRAFFASPGVDPNLISEKWVKNHYKWIVWKLSHYERSFPHIFGGRCLTPHNVMVQLKYRYDREVDRSQRSALRKVLERDEPSTRKMVLCVSDIKKTMNLDGGPADSSSVKSIAAYELGLTDGWYSCYTQTDPAMTRLIEEGKVAIGTKLITQGAELLNSDKGVSPLDAEDNVRLKISTNSTRRVKWDTKLGFQRNAGPLLVTLNSILPNGGLVGRIDVIIVRIYPVLYMEKKSDGSHVIRNTRAEDKAAAAYQQQQEAAIEKIYQEARSEVQNRVKGKEKSGIKLSLSNITKVTDAEELYKLYENCSDPSTFQNVLTSEQRDILTDYRRQKDENTNKEVSEIVREKIKTEKMNNRKVSPLLRIKIVDLHKPDYTHQVQFTVWNSTEDVSHMLSEGKALSIFNTTTSNSRFLKVIQLNSTRQTQYKELRKSVEYPARNLTRLNEFTSEYEPMFSEVDFVGIVVKIYDKYYGSRLSQTVFVTDLDFNYVGIVFWGNCKDFGWETTLTVNAVVACSNLQWKRNSCCIPSVYVNDSSVFTENPKQTHLREEIKRLKTLLPQDTQSFIRKCEEEISLKLVEEKHNSNASRNASTANDSSFTESVKPKSFNGFRMKPNASSTPCKSAPFGLDTSDQEPSPIQRRIEKLQMYGEPPPLSPLLPLGNLIKFKTKFRVPFKTCPSGDSGVA